MPASAWTESVLSEFRGQGFAGQMLVTPSGEIVVKRGPKARLKTTPTIPKGTVAIRAELVGSGILPEQQDALVFTSDHMFSSVSSAAAAVTGASANGRVSWRVPDG